MGKSISKSRQKDLTNLDGRVTSICSDIAAELNGIGVAMAALESRATALESENASLKEALADKKSNSEFERLKQWFGRQTDKSVNEITEVHEM